MGGMAYPLGDGRSPPGEQQAPMQGLRALGASDYRDGMTYKCFLAVMVLFSLPSACGLVDRIRGRDDTPPAAVTVPSGPLSAAAPLGGAQSAATLDQTTDAEKAAAKAAPAASGARNLGPVVVALGSPAEQGFWLRSALVSAQAKGRVVTAAGKSVNVDLQPGTGAALLSLAAYRALGLGLTDLPEVAVFAN